MSQAMIHQMKSAKRRNTTARQRVYDLLSETGTALSQDMIAEQLDGEMDRVTIYRMLHRFCEDGIAHRIMSDDGKQYYALCTDCDLQTHVHRHVHFKCTVCGRVECMNEEIVLPLPRGYRAEAVNFWVSGTCPRCR